MTYAARSPRPFQFRLGGLCVLTVAMATAFGLYRAGWLASVGLPVGLGLCLVATLAGTRVNNHRWMVGGIAGFVVGAFVYVGLVVTGPTCSIPQSHVCGMNLRQVILAVQSYEARHRKLPPPYLADASGRPMHSWRVLILPYLGEDKLYKQYRFDEPWDGPNNRKLHQQIARIYRCPSDPRGVMTSYLAVTGPGTAWDVNAPTNLSGLPNGAGTLLLVEVRQSGIHWMEPRDLHLSQMNGTINGSRGQGPSSLHPGGANLGFADSHVPFIRNGELTADDIRALSTYDSKGVELPR